MSVYSPSRFRSPVLTLECLSDKPTTGRPLRGVRTALSQKVRNYKEDWNRICAPVNCGANLHAGGIFEAQNQLRGCEVQRLLQPMGTHTRKAEKAESEAETLRR